jgi:hypothetical protein
VDLASVVRFISTFERGEPELTGRSRVERDLYSRDPTAVIKTIEPLHGSRSAR